jgi:multidrug efflux pump subunit AcrB
MIPLALGIGSGAQMLQPLAIAVIGGILASLLFSLIVTPAVHFFIAGRRRVVAAPIVPAPAPSNG